MDGIGCSRCGGIGGWIGASLVLGSKLCFGIMYSCFKVRDGWWMDHAFRQFGSHPSSQNSCIAMFNPCLIRFIGLV